MFSVCLYKQDVLYQCVPMTLHQPSPDCSKKKKKNVLLPLNAIKMTLAADLFMSCAQGARWSSGLHACLTCLRLGFRVSYVVPVPLLPLTFRKRSCRVHERLEIDVTGVDVSVNVCLYAPCHWLWVWGRMRQGEMDSGADCACIVLGCKRGSWCVRGSWEQYFSEYTWVGVAV